MIVLTAITEEDLDATTHLDAVAHDAAGATALFVGTVRDHDPGADGEVTRLEYSAHPDAAETLRDLAAAVDAEDLRIAITHRIGALSVGEIAIVCAVSSAHRAEAFDIARALVEKVKAEVPIWKRQITVDGSTYWVGL
ncbi:molybdenum cofactor biosynthesis protein MoaE [Microbacterium sp. M28]|uniref:molybdenum cofactor biosynthesis protein MoaE n=1 Tax=Microbacterium sp. M28 TaxID=2962064 RepID=UPI0021F449D2|nr:molybdenum cofactor biosynthesis protein MoaE [Microbacterium sp. M28]UYO95880.1 molybdenum cofactor biosynthesis protein MoaE [Microbacterium sp. M28]